MKGIPFRQISWGNTIMLGLARSVCAGLVLLILLSLTGELSSFNPAQWIIAWIFCSIVVIVVGLLFCFFLSLFPMGGWTARIIGTLVFCWGDPILYILSRVLRIFNFADLKLINFVAFLYVLKEEEEEENEIGIRKPPRRVD